LFSETQARAVVAVRPENEPELTALAEGHGVPAARLGLTGGADLAIDWADGGFKVPLAELGEASTGTLPRHFGD
jgi:phosphoribosylformylglycinamidine synthase